MKLTENQLRTIVRESIKNYIFEDCQEEGEKWDKIKKYGKYGLGAAGLLAALNYAGKEDQKVSDWENSPRTKAYYEWVGNPDMDMDFEEYCNIYNIPEYEKDSLDETIKRVLGNVLFESNLLNKYSSEDLEDPDYIEFSKEDSKSRKTGKKSGYSKHGYTHNHSFKGKRGEFVIGFDQY